MTNKISNPNNKKYDLLERTAVFGENIIGLTRAVKKDEISRPLISQLIRSSTSIGANYCEADAGESKKDFGINYQSAAKKPKKQCTG